MKSADDQKTPPKLRTRSQIPREPSPTQNINLMLIKGFSTLPNLMAESARDLVILGTPHAYT